MLSRARLIVQALEMNTVRVHMHYASIAFFTDHAARLCHNNMKCADAQMSEGLVLLRSLH
jgi:hypothetical protein